MTVEQHKVVAALPEPLEADAIYYVRAGAGFDLYVTNSAGLVVAYQHNAKLALNDLTERVEVLEESAAAQYTPAFKADETMLKLMHVTPGVLVAEQADGTPLSLQVAIDG